MASNGSSNSKTREWIGTVGVVVGALAAAAGLIFTGAQVRQNGIVQNRQYQLNLESQAKMVNVVPVGAVTAQGFDVTVVNRSEEPIYRLFVYVAFPEAADHTRGLMVAQAWQALPACTQATFNLVAIAKEYSQTAGRPMAGTSPTFDYGLVFTDSTGQTWHRHAAGFTHTTPWLEPLTGGQSREPVKPPVYIDYQLIDDKPTLTVPLAHQPDIVTAGPSAVSPCMDAGS